MPTYRIHAHKEIDLEPQQTPYINPTIEEFRKRYQPGYVYILAIRGIPGVYKIGESTNVNRRIKELTAGRRYELDAVLIVDAKDKYSLEQIAHTMCEEYRVSGEWFALPEGAIGKIEKQLKEINETL